jgi:hypothetical protein
MWRDRNELGKKPPIGSSATSGANRLPTSAKPGKYPLSPHRYMLGPTPRTT